MIIGAFIGFIIGGIFGFVMCAMLVASGDEGSREQSEGEWEVSNIPDEKYVCSVCGGACWYYDYQGEVAKSRYCPNCGAKMKRGGE